MIFAPPGTLLLHAMHGVGDVERLFERRNPRTPALGASFRGGKQR
jgi:hypothetical protein